MGEREECYGTILLDIAYRRGQSLFTYSNTLVAVVLCEEHIFFQNELEWTLLATSDIGRVYFHTLHLHPMHYV